MKYVPKNYKCQECQKEFYSFKENCQNCGATASLLPVSLPKSPGDFKKITLNLVDDYVQLCERVDHYEQVIELLQQKVKRYKGEVDELVEILERFDDV